MTANSEQPIVAFSSQSTFRIWLEKYHDKSNGIWLRFYKKGTDVPSISYAEALDEALCFGWIDGQAKKYDEQSYLQRFTPRRARSMWSKRNQEHVARLIAEKKMMPAGLAEIERAKADGRWDAAYESPANTVPPEDFVEAFSKNKKALEFWEQLNKTNRYAMIWQINSAKKEDTRQRRIDKFVGMMEKGEKLY